jgi:hypothetical protein
LVNQGDGCVILINSLKSAQFGRFLLLEYHFPYKVYQNVDKECDKPYRENENPDKEIKFFTGKMKFFTGKMKFFIRKMKFLIKK